MQLLRRITKARPGRGCHQYNFASKERFRCPLRLPLTHGRTMPRIRYECNVHACMCGFRARIRTNSLAVQVFQPSGTHHVHVAVPHPPVLEGKVWKGMIRGYRSINPCGLSMRKRSYCVFDAYDSRSAAGRTNQHERRCISIFLCFPFPRPRSRTS